MQCFIAQGWWAEHNTTGESVLMCDGSQIQKLYLDFYALPLDALRMP